MNQNNSEIKGSTPQTKVTIVGDEKLRTTCAKILIVAGNNDNHKAEDFGEASEVKGEENERDGEAGGVDGEKQAKTGYKSNNLETEVRHNDKLNSNILPLRTVEHNITKGEISPPVLDEVSSEQKTQVDVEMLNGEDSQEINLELDTTDGSTIKPMQINHEIKHNTLQTKVVVGNKKLRTELQSRTMLEAKKIDVSETMNSCAKVHSIAENNMEEDGSHQEEEDDDSSKQEKADNEWQAEDEKEEC